MSELNSEDVRYVLDVQRASRRLQTILEISETYGDVKPYTVPNPSAPFSPSSGSSAQPSSPPQSPIQSPFLQRSSSQRSSSQRPPINRSADRRQSVHRSSSQRSPMQTPPIQRSPVQRSRSPPSRPSTPIPSVPVAGPSGMQSRSSNTKRPYSKKKVAPRMRHPYNRGIEEMQSFDEEVEEKFLKMSLYFTDGPM